MIRVIVALGNPGAEYANTRHNAAWIAVDALVEKLGVSYRVERKFEAQVATIDQGKEFRKTSPDGKITTLTTIQNNFTIVKPLTFMNLSGQSVGAFLQFYKIPASALLLVHDEVAFPVGQVQLKEGGGSGGHNGVADVIRAIGNPDFWRLRLGVTPASPAGYARPEGMILADFVLGRLEAEAITWLKSEKMTENIIDIVDKGPALLQNRLNQHLFTDGKEKL